MTFTKRLPYRFGDIDDAGIAYYPSFFHYFHCAFEDWWAEALGRPYHEVLHDEKFGLPAVSVHSDFYAPIRYGDAPDIHLGVLRIGNSSVEFAYWMTCGDDPRPRCRARITCVGVDMDSMQKQPIPAHWRERFAAFSIDEADIPQRG